jgi:hypothetical protein
MTILNKNSYYRLHTSFVSETNYIGSYHWRFPTISKVTGGNFFFHVWDDSEHDYWFIDIFNGNAFDSYPIETIVPEDILKKIWNKEIFLIIATTHEGYHHAVGGIYLDLIIRANIPEEQIILVSESADILKEVEAVSKKYNRKPIKVEWIRIFEANTLKEVRHQQTPFPVTLEDKPYDKKFLSFNRHMMTHGRLHRGSLIALLCATDLLDKGYISSGMFYEYPTWADIFDENGREGLCHQHRDSPEIMKLLTDNKEKILNIGKLVIDADYDVLQERNNALILPTTDHFYSNSYFSVVTETNCFAKGLTEGELTPPGRQLSEKTFKPIGLKHPFILVAPANTLDILKEIGYKTFGPWIDESYDNETNESARMLMIVKEIKRLCELSPLELTEYLTNVREICNYNYNLLLSKTTYSTKLN